MLIIGTTGTKTPFLSEGDVPEHARLNQTESVTDQAEEDRQLAEALAKSSQDTGKNLNSVKRLSLTSLALDVFGVCHWFLIIVRENHRFFSPKIIQNHI